MSNINIPYQKFFNSAMREVMVSSLESIAKNKQILPAEGILIKFITGHKGNVLPRRILPEEEYTINLVPNFYENLVVDRVGKSFSLDIILESDDIERVTVAIDAVISFIDSSENIMIEIEPELSGVKENLLN